MVGSTRFTRSFSSAALAHTAANQLQASVSFTTTQVAVGELLTCQWFKHDSNSSMLGIQGWQRIFTKTMQALWWVNVARAQPRHFRFHIGIFTWVLGFK